MIHPFSNAVTSTVNPYAPRSILGSIAWPMISALGASAALDCANKYRKFVLIFFALVITFSVYIYLYKYYKEYPLYSSDFSGWQSGPREIMKTFISEKDYYDELIIYGDFNAPDIFIKFYDPKNLCGEKCRIGKIDDFDPKIKQLYAIGFNKMKDLTENLEFIQTKTIYYPNNSPSFYLGELKEK